MVLFFFFFNDTATTEIYTLSLHDALPISGCPRAPAAAAGAGPPAGRPGMPRPVRWPPPFRRPVRCRHQQAALRSEEHTSELQSRQYLVCRLLLEKKKKNTRQHNSHIVMYK